jgi:hypothetical protein
MADALKAYFDAWLEHRVKQAFEELETTWTLTSSGHTARGRFFSGAHLTQLVSDAKQISLKLAQDAFSHAEREGVPASVAIDIPHRVIGFYESWQPKLRSRTEKIYRPNQHGVKEAIERLVTATGEDLKGFCNVSTLKIVAKTSLTSPNEPPPVPGALGEPIAKTQTAESAEYSRNTLPTLADKQLEAVYKQRVSTWPEGEKPPSREDDYRWFQGQSREVTHAMTRRLRAQHAPPHWVNAGRRGGK